ncbi:MAG: hypothetical protein HQK55_08135 [Deltaproteobacteria bacterium]|nr:hypothetical protein [Deltaproteobacteria bacterium]
MKIVISVIMALVVSLPVAGWGAGASDAMRKASASYSRGDFPSTIDSLRDALEAAWIEAPLTAQNVTFVSAPPQGFRKFKARADNIFETIDPVQLYIEPVGCILKKEGQTYRIAVSADFAVMDEKGTALGGQNGIEALKAEVQSFSTEIMMTFTFVPKGLPPGNYKLAVILNDKNSDKTAKFEKDFVIKK